MVYDRRQEELRRGLPEDPLWGTVKAVVHNQPHGDIRYMLSFCHLEWGVRLSTDTGWGVPGGILRGLKVGAPSPWCNRECPWGSQHARQGDYLSRLCLNSQRAPACCSAGARGRRAELVHFLPARLRMSISRYRCSAYVDSLSEEWSLS